MLHRQQIAIMRILQSCAYTSYFTTNVMQMYKSPNSGAVRSMRGTYRMRQTATCRSMHHQRMCYFWMCCCGDAYTAADLVRTL